jgi:hypothetical protein
MRGGHRYSAGLIVAIALGSPAIGADLLPLPAQPVMSDSPDEWQVSFAPYFWIAGLDGKSQVFGLGTFDVSQDFVDVLPDLDFGFMASGQARHGRFSIFTDMSYVKVTTESATPLGIIADDVAVRSITFTALLGGAYTIYEDERGHLDILAAARYWDTETRISLSGGLVGNVSDTDSGKWVDGLVGFKGSYSFTDRIFMTGWGMIGAGGADIDWDVLAGLGYRFNDTISAVAGYRAQGVDYSSGGYTYDMIQHGPIIGMDIKF